MTHITTQSELVAALAKPDGGFDLHLNGSFDAVRIAARYANPIRIHAGQSTVSGVTIVGAGVQWIGGTIRASGGASGFAAAGYGARIHASAARVEFIGTRFIDANRGIVIDQASSVMIYDCEFTVRQDGIIASQSRGLRILNNRFIDFTPQPGDHSDAVQLRHACTDCIVDGNTIRNVSQGIGQMDGPNDAPLEGLLIRRNNVAIHGGHSITVYRCPRLVVVDNTVRQITPGKRTVYRLPLDCIQYNNQILR